MQGRRRELEGGGVNTLEGGGQYSKTLTFKKGGGYINTPAPMVAPPTVTRKLARNLADINVSSVRHTSWRKTRFRSLCKSC